MNYQNFDHPIRRVIPSIKVRWNVNYNLSDRSFNVLMQKIGLTVVDLQYNEWQRISIDHLSHVLGLNVPHFLCHLTLSCPAISFRSALVLKAPKGG